ncbi:GDP-mannose dehydrogenase [Devosia psychrophila]|uniref:GDP-mannose dehydrogenase n=1 Tax=Devosia psychrophila TaxID=728005 RepID=A0ABR5E2Z0_9HYPH|nr:nucleotide sugar dehydrogenase [Devosia psychrophila]KKC34569.1 GDP-mannose dehydrogenase [Devosia psychrophila]
MLSQRRLAVVGLGYVGLPVAVTFGLKGASVLGFDIDKKRVAALKAGDDWTLEVEPADLISSKLEVSDDVADLKRADFFIVTVPTPIDSARRPDLTALLSASKSVGSALKKGDIVVYESTVYPGATEEDCIPVLEKQSGMKAGVDFFVGYSPERINPGDKEHRFENIRKVVSGQDKVTAEIIAAVYGAVVKAGIHIAPSIKVAEAAKVIENAQRDINIAFMNELSEIFHLLGVDTSDVLAAAATKWNFLNFTPGLVGGHCIGVDPYYLTYRAEREGYHPQVILAGRRVNDSAGERIAHECIRLSMADGRAVRRVTVLGVTFKEDVPDIRNTRVIDIVRELEKFGIEVQIADPLARAEDLIHEYGYKLTALNDLAPADAIILAVPHREFVEGGWALISSALHNDKGVVLDVKSKLDPARKPENITLWRL